MYKHLESMCKINYEGRVGNVCNNKENYVYIYKDGMRSILKIPCQPLPCNPTTIPCWLPMYSLVSACEHIR